jgi:Bacterial SH3 domain
MTDTGLSNRLRQHSRRSGIAVGLTMAATIALCVLTSAYIFGQIEPYVAEVTGYEEATSVPEVAAQYDEGEEQPEQEAPAEDEGEAQAAEEPAEGQPTVASSEPTATTSSFTPTHNSNPDFTINFRPGPSVASGDPIDSLVPGTPLQFLNEEAQDEEGVIWLRVQTETGQVGWIREVDTQPIIQ